MIRRLLILAVTLLTAACETTPTSPQNQTPDRQVPTGQAADSILELIAAAESSAPARANEWRIEAAELALRNADPSQA